MISIPPDVLVALAADFGLTPDELTHLGGGHVSSDGTAFSFEQDGQARVLKIMAAPADDRNSLFIMIRTWRTFW